jgi:hypothetical protein
LRRQAGRGRRAAALTALRDRHRVWVGVRQRAIEQAVQSLLGLVEPTQRGQCLDVTRPQREGDEPEVERTACD